jgi:hypothetical protein
VFHADIRDIPQAKKEVILQNIGNLKRLIRLAGPPMVPIEELSRDGGGSMG